MNFLHVSKCKKGLKKQCMTKLIEFTGINSEEKIKFRLVVEKNLNLGLKKLIIHTIDNDIESDDDMIKRDKNKCLQDLRDGAKYFSVFGFQWFDNIKKAKENYEAIPLRKSKINKICVINIPSEDHNFLNKENFIYFEENDNSSEIFFNLNKIKDNLNFKEKNYCFNFDEFISMNYCNKKNYEENFHKIIKKFFILKKNSMITFFGQNNYTQKKILYGHNTETGLLFYIFKDLISEFNWLKECDQNYCLYLNFIEIIKDSAFDLLDKKKLHFFLKKENRKIKNKIINTIDDLGNVFSYFQLKNRAFNIENNYFDSHYAIKLEINHFPQSKRDKSKPFSLLLVDLGISENFDKDNFIQIKEGEDLGYQDPSLKNLKNCLKKISDNPNIKIDKLKNDLPFGDSKLTEIMRDYFTEDKAIYFVYFIKYDEKKILNNLSILDFYSGKPKENECEYKDEKNIEENKVMKSQKIIPKNSNFKNEKIENEIEDKEFEINLSKQVKNMSLDEINTQINEYNNKYRYVQRKLKILKDQKKKKNKIRKIKIKESKNIIVYKNNI